MGTSLNKNLMTPLKGCYFFAASVQIGAAGAVGAIEQGDSGFIDSVTLVATAIYRFKINYQLRAFKEIVIIPSVASQTAAGSNRKAYYDNGTYNATTGEFDIVTTDLVAASPVATVPVNGDAIHVMCVFPFYKNL